MIKKFKKVLNKVFLFCPKTKEMLDFREELLGILMDKYNDNIANGLNSKESYEECIKSIGEYRETIKELEKMRSKKRKLTNEKIIFNALVFVCFTLATLIIYFVASFVSQAWDMTWLTFIGAVIVTMFVSAIHFLIKGQEYSRYRMVRTSIFIISMLVTVTVYLIVSFTTGMWNYTWLTFIAGITIAYLLDVIYRMTAKRKIYTGFDAFMITMLVTVFVYLIVSLATKQWGLTWIIFLVGLFVYTLLMVIKQLIKIKKEKE